jgi:hypothetical protein
VSGTARAYPQLDPATVAMLRDGEEELGHDVQRPSGLHDRRGIQDLTPAQFPIVPASGRGCQPRPAQLCYQALVHDYVATFQRHGCAGVEHRGRVSRDVATASTWRRGVDLGQGKPGRDGPVGVLGGVQDGLCCA